MRGVDISSVFQPLFKEQVRTNLFPSVNLADNSAAMEIDGAALYLPLSDVKVGDTFTIWVEDIETNNPTGEFLCGLFINSNGDWNDDLKKGTPISLTATKEGVNRLGIFPGPRSNPYGYKATFKNVCLVKGEVPMQWMPSVNDIVQKAKQ